MESGSIWGDHLVMYVSLQLTFSSFVLIGVLSVRALSET